jgi:hypothetical protein
MPGSQILHKKTRSVKLHRTRIVRYKLTNRKKIVNHLRSNKDIRETERTMSRTHRSDRKTRTITDHDGRTRGVRRSDRRKDTRIWSGVVRGIRVGNPLGANGRSQSHSAEELCQGSLIPPPRPRRAGRRGWGPGRRIGGSTPDHGHRLVWGTSPPP